MLLAFCIQLSAHSFILPIICLCLNAEKKLTVCFRDCLKEPLSFQRKNFLELVPMLSFLNAFYF